MSYCVYHVYFSNGNKINDVDLPKDLYIYIFGLKVLDEVFYEYPDMIDNNTTFLSLLNSTTYKFSILRCMLNINLRYDSKSKASDDEDIGSCGFGPDS
jgi:hypothetical protein